MRLGWSLVLIGCTGSTAPEVTSSDIEPLPMDDVLRMNHVQAKGSHNSSHVQSENVFDDSHRYTHPPLDEQLDLWQVRQLELDLHWHLDLGLQVHHLTGIDQKSSCPQFADCLDTVAAWSDSHRQHSPILIFLEYKDDDVDQIHPDYGELDGRWPDIEDALLTAFGRERMIVPDDVRGDHPTLPAAIAADGWPTLGEARGKIYVSILNGGDPRDEYLEGASNLEGRVMFTRSPDPDVADAGVFKDMGASTATELAELGFITTSNVSGAGQDFASQEAERLEMAAAGLHHLATDFVAPSATEEGWFDLPVGCNPRTAPEGCTPEMVDPY